MLVLHFFKAGKPYNKTQGYQHNHHWMNGVAGPMSMQECLKLSANMGGLIITKKFPEITSLEKFFEILEVEGFEKDDEGTLDEHAPELTGLPEEGLAEAMEDNFNEAPEITADVLLGVSFDEFMDLNNKNVRQIADNLEIIIPEYSEQVSLLSDAKAAETFNFTKYIGKSKTPIDTLKAFVLMRVGEMLHPVEATE